MRISSIAHSSTQPVLLYPLLLLIQGAGRAEAGISPGKQHLCWDIVLSHLTHCVGARRSRVSPAPDHNNASESGRPSEQFAPVRSRAQLRLYPHLAMLLLLDSIL